MVGLQTSSVFILIYSEVTGPERKVGCLISLSSILVDANPGLFALRLSLFCSLTHVPVRLVPRAKNSRRLRAASRDLVTSLRSEVEFGEDNQALLACALVLSPWDPKIAPAVY